MTRQQPINFEAGRVYRIIDPNYIEGRALYISTGLVDTTLIKSKRVNCYSFIIFDRRHTPGCFKYGVLRDGEFITDSLGISLLNELSHNRVIECNLNSEKEFERFAFRAFRNVALQTIAKAGGVKI